MDPYEYLQISRNSDGSITRRDMFPLSPATGDLQPKNPSDVLSKDLPLNPSLSTSLRLFLPAAVASSPLPLILFFHGGGFVFLSPADSINHRFCEKLAASVPAVVASVKYRLAPENRLPAAFHDAADALLWLRSQALAADPWLAERADFTRCFIAGSSAGGNIAYHAALRARGLDLGPAKLVGMVLNQPFFGGEERTASELQAGGDGSVLPLAATDAMWELSLPEGASRDHEYCNVAAAEGKVKGLPRCLLTGFDGDLLVDRQREVGEMLARGGVDVVVKIEEGGFHGADVMGGKDEVLFSEIREFIVNSGDGVGGARDVGDGGVGLR